MTTFYANSEEKYLKSVVVYAFYKSDHYVPTWDIEGTNPIYSDDALNLFTKGLMLIGIISNDAVPTLLGYAIPKGVYFDVDCINVMFEDDAGDPVSMSVMNPPAEEADEDDSEIV